MKIIVFEPNKKPEVREIPDDGKAAYDAVHDILGGYLQLLSFMATCDAYVDEEAKVNGKSFTKNILATQVFKSVIALDNRVMLPGDFIANNMVIVGNVNADGFQDEEWHDLLQKDIEEIMSVSELASKGEAI